MRVMINQTVCAQKLFTWLMNNEEISMRRHDCANRFGIALHKEMMAAVLRILPEAEVEVNIVVEDKAGGDHPLAEIIINGLPETHDVLQSELRKCFQTALLSNWLA